MKLHKYIFLPALIFSILLSSCANPINAKIGSKYYDAGMAAEARGDLKTARENYRRAYINARVGHLGYKAQAYSLYEYSRLSGYLKNYKESEYGFRKTLQLIEKAKPKANKLKAPTLSELARLLNNINKHKKAVAVFKLALKELDQANAKKLDPIAYADFLKLYSQSLRLIGNSEYKKITKQEKQIRLKSIGKKAEFKAKRY